MFSGNIISIAYFNFSGISVAKEISATTRMVLDSVRTFFIWTFSLAIGWQGFHPLQVTINFIFGFPQMGFTIKYFLFIIFNWPFFYWERKSLSTIKIDINIVLVMSIL